MTAAVVIASLAGLALFYRAAVREASPRERTRLTVTEVARLADLVAGRDFPAIPPLMLRSIAEIESGRDPEAFRAEPQIGDASTGLMQTLLGTARWLATDIGADRFGVPELVDLLDPEMSMYFGAAYLNWLRTFKDQVRDEQFMVRGYNGGPDGINRTATVQYWRRYREAKSRLEG